MQEASCAEMSLYDDVKVMTVRDDDHGQCGFDNLWRSGVDNTTPSLKSKPVFLQLSNPNYRDTMTDQQPGFKIIHPAFKEVLGSRPDIRLYLEHNECAWAHEACVFIPSTGDLFVTSNRIVNPANEDDQKILITKVNISSDASAARRDEIPQTAIVMANGGVNYKGGILFCDQGNHTSPAGLYYMDARPPHATTPVLLDFNGRSFNSLNDVVVHPLDGSIWFTDPMYGAEQGFRPPAQLPNQVYRYDPANGGGVRAVADGFDRPNGLCFSPDLETLYVTDTGYIHGDGTTSFQRPASM